MTNWLIAIWVVFPIAAVVYLTLLLVDIAGKAKRAASPLLEMAEHANRLSELSAQMPIIAKSEGNLFDDPAKLVAEQKEIRRSQQVKRQERQRRLIARLKQSQGSEN